MVLVLVGYMGSGKTTVGKILSEKMNIPFIDMDDRLENYLGMRVSEVFETNGELFFRKKENELLASLLEEGPMVLSTGGGVPCYSGNMDLILEKGTAIYLKLGVPELVDRLSKEKEHRPLISHLSDEDLPEFIGKHLFERNPFYQKAQLTISCEHKNPHEIAEEIYTYVK